MCAPKVKQSTQKLPEAPAAPPPPEETAQVFATAYENEGRSQIQKKKKGTQSLKLFNVSPLFISSTGNKKSSSGISIP